MRSTKQHTDTSIRHDKPAMEYNTGKPLMIIPEYGRHVQKMVEHLLTIKDRSERTKATEVVIQTMAQVHPYAKDGEELRRKLWDHLYIITNYKLDVESPYPKLMQGIVEARPKKLHYPGSLVKYTHYGKIIPELIKKAIQMDDGGEKDALVESIAMLMKKAYMIWNKSTVNDNTIVKTLGEMSGGKLILKDISKLNSVTVSIIPQKPTNMGRNPKRNKNKDRNKRNRRNRNGGF